MKLSGRVETGMGDCARWIEQLGEHYFGKTGMVLYPGTLNVRLDRPFQMPGSVARLEAAEYGGTVSVSILPCTCRGRKAFILRTDANDRGRGDHPLTVVEIATDVRLRDHFGLKDGDAVTIEVS
jgi:riboflavin kinase